MFLLKLSFHLKRFEDAKEFKYAVRVGNIAPVIYRFQARVRLVILENGQHIEKYSINEQSLVFCDLLFFKFTFVTFMQLQFAIVNI